MASTLTIMTIFGFLPWVKRVEERGNDAQITKKKRLLYISAPED
jgi:hypothetical protein